MAFTKILPQVINIAKKAVNPIRTATSKTPPTDSTNTTTSSTVSSGSINTEPLEPTIGSATGVTIADLRIRLSMPKDAPAIFYKDEQNILLAPLKETAGFIFPIQPDITMNHSAEYQSTKPTHSNFPYYHYTSSEIQQISISGEFPVRSVGDAKYVNAGIHFLRSCTRMFNNRDGQYAGAPPMVLRLTGLGFSGFDNIPVVVTSVNVNYPNSVDFITFKPFSNLIETAKIASLVTIQVTLNPVFSRDYISKVYGTLNFSSGNVRSLGVTPSYAKITTPLPQVFNTAPPEISTVTSIKDLPQPVGGVGQLPGAVPNVTAVGLSGTIGSGGQSDFDFIAAQGGDAGSAGAYIGSLANLPPPPPQQTGVSTSGPKIPGSPAGFGGSTTPNI